MLDCITLTDLLYYDEACCETAWRIGSCADQGDWDPEADKYYKKSNAADTVLLDLFFDGDEEALKQARGRISDKTKMHEKFEPPELYWEDALKAKEEKTMKVTLEYVPKRATGKDKARINLVCNGKIESFWVDEETGALEEINTIPQIVELEF